MDWGYAHRCRFAKGQIILSAVWNRIQGSNSGGCFCWCHKAQKHNSSGAAKSQGWNCSPCIVLRMGPCFANLLQYAGLSVLNMRKRRSGCKCSREWGYSWQRNVLQKLSQAEISFGQGSHSMHTCTTASSQFLSALGRTARCGAASFEGRCEGTKGCIFPRNYAGSSLSKAHVFKLYCHLHLFVCVLRNSSAS